MSARIAFDGVCQASLSDATNKGTRTDATNKTLFDAMHDGTGFDATHASRNGTADRCILGHAEPACTIASI